MTHLELILNQLQVLTVFDSRLETSIPNLVCSLPSLETFSLLLKEIISMRKTAPVFREVVVQYTAQRLRVKSLVVCGNQEEPKVLTMAYREG
jgi:hypothetical protein